MKPGARSLSVDSACAGRNSCRSNHLRHANQHGFLSQPLQYRDKRTSLIGTKQQTDYQDQKALFDSPLFYSEEGHNAYRHWDLGSRTHLDKASTEGSLSPRSGNHGKSIPQNTPSRIARNAVRAYEALAFPYPAESSAVGDRQRHNGGTHKEHHNLQADALLGRLDNSQTRYKGSPQLRRRTTTQCTNFKNTVVQAGKCPGLNNTNCGVSYTSRTGPPFSSCSSCSRMALSCSCWFASNRCEPMVRKIK